MVKTKNLSFEDVHKRCNFLYQAAQESLVLNPSDVSLCRFYINTMTVIARRQGIHLHPDIKRSICKRCCLFLKPGITAIYRAKKKRQKQSIVTCLGCGTFRRYVYNKNNIHHFDRPDVWVDTIVNGESVGKQPQQQKQNQQQQQKGGTKKKHTAEAMETNVECDKTNTASVSNTDSQTNNKPESECVTMTSEDKVT